MRCVQRLITPKFTPPVNRSHPHERAPFPQERASGPGERAVDTRNHALRPHERAARPPPRASHLRKRALHSHKRTFRPRTRAFRAHDRTHRTAKAAQIPLRHPKRTSAPFPATWFASRPPSTPRRARSPRCGEWGKKKTTLAQYCNIDLRPRPNHARAKRVSMPHKSSKQPSRLQSTRPAFDKLRNML
jgi:hypothetical protein